MPQNTYEHISDTKLEAVIREVIEERCKICKIQPDDLLGNIFNINWIKQWVRAGMPIDRRDQDFKYEALMFNCREKLRKKLLLTV